MPSFRAQSRNPPCTLFFLAPFAEGFQFYFVTHTTLYRCARKIEDFTRDDDTEIALSKHIRCTLREINPFSHTVISSAARNLPCTLLFLAPFAKGFPFFAVTHTTLYRYARKIPRLRSGWRCGSGVFPTYPLYGTWVTHPHAVISSAVEKSSLHSVLPCPFRGRLPILLCHTYDAISVCKKDRGLHSGWRYRNSAFQTYPLYATWNKPILPYRHFERSEKSSLHSALSCSFRKSFPLFRYHTYGAIPVCKKDRGLRSGWRYGNSAFSAHPLYDA